MRFRWALNPTSILTGDRKGPKTQRGMQKGEADVGAMRPRDTRGVTKSWGGGRGGEQQGPFPAAFGGSAALLTLSDFWPPEPGRHISVVFTTLQSLVKAARGNDLRRNPDSSPSPTSRRTSQQMPPPKATQCHALVDYGASPLRIADWVRVTARPVIFVTTLRCF